METTSNECSDGNKGDKDKHCYSVPGCAQGNDAAFSQSNNAFLHILFFYRSAVAFMQLMCTVCVHIYSHIFLDGCLTDSGSLYGAGGSE